MTRAPRTNRSAPAVGSRLAGTAATARRWVQPAAALAVIGSLVALTLGGPTPSETGTTDPAPRPRRSGSWTVETRPSQPDRNKVQDEAEAIVSDPSQYGFEAALPSRSATNEIPATTSRSATTDRPVTTLQSTATRRSEPASRSGTTRLPETTRQSGTTMQPATTLQSGTTRRPGVRPVTTVPTAALVTAATDRFVNATGGRVTTSQIRPAPTTTASSTSATTPTTSSTVTATSTGTTTTTPAPPVGGCATATTGATGQFRVEALTGAVIDPCGFEFAGAGMNGGYTLFPYPYVFQGTDGGVFDVWLDDPDNGGFHPGGGFSSGMVWDPVTSSRVELPDRYYAINGSTTPGVPAPADHWHQRFLRINLVAQGGGGSPDTEQTLAEVEHDVLEGVGHGVVQILETHDVTGDNHVPTMAWDDPTPTATDDFPAVVRFNDGLVTRFADGGGGTTGGSVGNPDPVTRGYVWFNPTNEPWGNSALADGCPPAAYFDTQTFWIRRIRNLFQAENIIVIDLSEWGQDLWGLANGCYDSWWQSLANDDSGDLTRNVVLSWHAYGARRPNRNEPYTYTTMNADLAAATEAFPLMIGEYGQPAGSGVNFAGPWRWNVDAVTWLTTDENGPALIDRYRLLAAVWTATGDTAYAHNFKLVRGPNPATLDGEATPFWDVASGDDPRLERLGRVHWDLARRLWPDR